MKQLWLRTRLVFSAFLPALWRHLPAKWRGTILIIRDVALPAIWIYIGIAVPMAPGWLRVWCGAIGGMFLYRFIAIYTAAVVEHRRRKAGITSAPQPSMDDRALLAVAGQADNGQFEVAVLTGSELDLPQRQAALRAIRAAVEAEQRKLVKRSMT